MSGDVDELYVGLQFSFLGGREIRFSVLGNESWSGIARIVDATGRFARIISAHAVRTGSALRLDADDTLLLGECVACECMTANVYEISVSIEQVVPSMTNLARLVNAICHSPNRVPDRQDTYASVTTRT